MSVRFRSNHGSALLIVLTLTTVMTGLIIANSVSLHHLQKELRRVEHRQQQKYATDVLSQPKQR